MNEASFRSDPLVRQVRDIYTAELARLAPQLAGPAALVLDRISTLNWTPEWFLPRWLGESFDLPADTTRSLVLANIYGLTMVRLQDDLVDGETGQAAMTSTLLLSTALHHLWLAEYVPLFDARSTFWSYLEQYMAQWLRATQGSVHGPAKAYENYSEQDFLRLGERGAPLKICCAATCLLANNAPLILPLTGAVDHLLVAAVLLDHLKDWDADLSANRYNVFVAYASPHRQVAPQRDANRSKVLEEIVLGEAARPYFERIQGHLRLAGQKAGEVGCPPLRTYVQGLGREVEAARDRIASETREWLEMVTETLFGAKG